MNKEQKNIIIKYRLERAEESLSAAELLYKNEMYLPAMNRIYYSMFYAVQALLIINEKSFSKHSQVKGYFNKEYIKTGVFPKNIGKTFNIVFEYRQKFDYVDLILPDRELVNDYIKEARHFIDKILDYIDKNIY